MFKDLLRALDRPVSPVYSAGQVLDFGAYRLRLKVNARSRRISLRIDNKTGEAIVSAPRQRDLKDAVDFARTRHDWILDKSSHQTAPEAFKPGIILTINGTGVVLGEKAGVISPRLIEADDGTRMLITSGDGPTYARRIERYLRQQALKTVQAETDKYAAMLGVSGVAPTSSDVGKRANLEMKTGAPEPLRGARAAPEHIKVSLFDAKGRWGSCTPSRRTIRYSWRLILAPKEVLSYVCAHEVGHLRHGDHSAAFWAQVTALFGPYKPARDWLKKHGHDLFKYQ